MHRFFAPGFDPGDEHATLLPDEAEHLTRVLRLTVGDTVSVFDGRGHEYLARITEASRRTVRVQILTIVAPAAEPAVAVTLVQAVLKGEKMDDVVRDAVMLGVAAVQPVVTARSETTVAALARSSRGERWQRVALASVKQCGRAVLPDVRHPLHIDDWMGDRRPALTLMLVEPRAGAETRPLAFLLDEPTPSEAAVMVGAEGGWTDREWTAARERGIHLVTLGTRTLRADAVPAAALSVLQFVWGDL